MMAMTTRSSISVNDRFADGRRSMTLRLLLQAADDADQRQEQTR